jgi:hypothetical protein
MGLDLTLAPVRFGDPWWLLHTRIDLDRNYELFDQIVNHRDTAKQLCIPYAVPSDIKLQWYGDDGIATTATDPYGKPLHYVFAGDLARVKLPASTGAWNKAVFAMICAMPRDTKVVLYWH